MYVGMYDQPYIYIYTYYIHTHSYKYILCITYYTHILLYTQLNTNAYIHAKHKKYT